MPCTVDTDYPDFDDDPFDPTPEESGFDEMPGYLQELQRALQRAKWRENILQGLLSHVEDLLVTPGGANLLETGFCAFEERPIDIAYHLLLRQVMDGECEEVVLIESNMKLETGPHRLHTEMVATGKDYFEAGSDMTVLEEILGMHGTDASRIAVVVERASWDDDAPAPEGHEDVLPILVALRNAGARIFANMQSPLVRLSQQRDTWNFTGGMTCLEITATSKE